MHIILSSYGREQLGRNSDRPRNVVASKLHARKTHYAFIRYSDNTAQHNGLFSSLCYIIVPSSLVLHSSICDT